MNKRIKNKKYILNNPLFYGTIWNDKYIEEKEYKYPLEKYRFKRRNKAKNIHKYECKFWNNRCNLMINKDAVFITSYGIKEDEHIISLLFNYSHYTYEEIKWYVETLNKFNKVNYNGEISIENIGYYFVKTFSNGAVMFEEKINDNELPYKRVVFWLDEIVLYDTFKDNYEEEDRIQIKSGNGEEVYFPANCGLQIPIGLLETMFNEMEQMKNNE